MASFTNLHHVGEVLAGVLQVEIDPPLAPNQVLVAPPPESPGVADQHVRVSLMWFNEQPGHVNDGFEPRFDGTLEAPPVTLSAYYMITGYGDNPAGEPVVGHQLLGSAVRVLHANKHIRLPLPALPARGEGSVDVDLIAITPELEEKLFSPLQLRHRAFALYEVGPVQLVPVTDELPPAPLVRPGGAVLEVEQLTAPAIERIYPSPQALSGRIRIDGAFPEGFPDPTEDDRVIVGGVTFESADITAIAPGHSFSIDLGTGPPGLTEGAHSVKMLSGSRSSKRTMIALTHATASTIDPLLVPDWDIAADLVLSGRGLAGADQVAVWPEAGIRSPRDVVEMPLSAVAAASVTIAAAQLTANAKPLLSGDQRLAIHLGSQRYTPSIVVRFTS